MKSQPGRILLRFAGIALVGGTLGLSAYLDHNWSTRFSSAIGYSLVNIENTDGQTGSAFHRGHYASTNLLFYPVENAMIGAELVWGRRENFRDGFASDDVRVQFAFKYNFSKNFHLLNRREKTASAC